MKNVAVILANGFEELEAVTIVDVLRRGGVNTKSVGFSGKNCVGAHNIEIKADLDLSELKVENFDMIVLPGGLENNKFLANNEKIHEILKEFDAKNLKIAAICAAPWVLGSAGVLKNSYTCYPSFEQKAGAKGFVDDKNVVKDGRITTSRGPATAMEFALELLKDLAGEAVYSEVKAGLLFK